MAWTWKFNLSNFPTASNLNGEFNRKFDGPAAVRSKFEPNLELLPQLSAYHRAPPPGSTYITGPIPFPHDSGGAAAMLHRPVRKRHGATPQLREEQKRKPVAEGDACLQLQPLQERSNLVRSYPANPYCSSPPPSSSIDRASCWDKPRALTASERAASGVFSLSVFG
jgi:hypothetical protein